MTNKLYVGNLAYRTRSPDLEAAFAPYGEIVEAKVIEDRMTGRSRGFGFVTFVSAEDADKAVKDMDGKELLGRAISVSLAQERTERSDRSDRPERSDRPRNGGGDRRERFSGRRYS